jgi:Protein of unknown function (DUF3303)
MQFMVIERFRNGARPVYERFERDGRLMGAQEGIEFVASWVSADLTRCFQVMECDDITLLQAWVANWEDLTAFEIVPVVAGSRVGDAVRARE